MQQNKDKSKKVCTDSIQQLYARIQQASATGKYAVPGGYQLYMDDMKQLKQDYEGSSARGVMKETVLKEFLEDQEPRRREVQALDEKLDQQAKELKGLFIMILRLHAITT